MYNVILKAIENCGLTFNVNIFATILGSLLLDFIIMHFNEFRYIKIQKISGLNFVWNLSFRTIKINTIYRFYLERSEVFALFFLSTI